MTTDPPKPHFMVVIDETAGEMVSLTEGPDGELTYTMHPMAAAEDSPVRPAAHAMLRKAVEMLIARSQRESERPSRPLPHSA